MEKNHPTFEKEYLEKGKIPGPEEYINKLHELGYENLAEAYKQVIALSRAIKAAGGQGDDGDDVEEGGPHR